MTVVVANGFSPVRTAVPSDRVPQGWAWVPLLDVARLESGHTPSRRQPEYWDGGDVPWLSLKDVSALKGKRVYETQDMPTNLGIENSSARLLPADTVALCRTASVGKVAILGGEMATSQDFVNWVCGPRLDPDFLFWAFKASELTFLKEKQGSTHQTIYMPTVRRFAVLLPPIEEQRRIADILDRADAIRRKRRAAIALTEELLRSTFLDMFGDPVTNPKGWPAAKLGELAEVQGGLQVSRKRARHPIEVPYLRVANVYRASLDLDEVKAMRVTERELERTRLASGDILLVEGHGNLNEIGRAAIWDGSIADCVHQNHLIRTRVNPDNADAVYVTAFINSAGGQRQLQRFGKTTSGLNTISTRQVRALNVLAPPLDLQLSYASHAAAIGAVRDRLTAAADKADTLFHALTQRAFRGDL